jgi:SAM-dependent methyltransferase
MRLDLMARLEDFVPPRDLFWARANYADVGRALFKLLVDVAELGADERVLDVGCGTGRLAVPLADHLGASGSYEGFDNRADRVAWCQEKIEPLHPNFRFRAVDVFNTLYNPEGAIRADEFTFPYADEEFDLVFLISVFTHMLDKAVERYLSEIARVMRPGGRCLISWFLLNEESLRALEEQKDERRDPAGNAYTALFSHDFGVYRLSDLGRPECIVAFDESYILDLYAREKLEIRQPIHYGDWTGRKNALGNQDYVLAYRS